MRPMANDREHRGRDAEGAQDHTLEVHIGIQFAFDEIVVLESSRLQLLGHGQHRLALLLDDPDPRIEVLVDPVSETRRMLLLLSFTWAT